MFGPWVHVINGGFGLGREKVKRCPLQLCCWALRQKLYIWTLQLQQLQESLFQTPVHHHTQWRRNTSNEKPSNNTVEGVCLMIQCFKHDPKLLSIGIFTSQSVACL